MKTTTVIYLILVLLLSISIAYFQYIYKNKDKRKINIILFFLRTLSLFLLGLLFVNPIIEVKKETEEKPVLAVLVDNSFSMQYFKQEKEVKKLLKKLKENKDLNNKFDIRYFAFAKDVDTLDSLSFNQSQTNIYKAITDVNQVFEKRKGAVLLLSDGNQTTGNDYEFIAKNKAVYPIVFGDTTTYNDIQITRVNVNKYSYIKNKFPVETFLFYQGKEEVNTQFAIYRDGKKMYQKKIKFSPQKNTQIVTVNLTSLKEGKHYYTAVISKIKREKNTQNNRKNFSIEVINEQTKVLILTSLLHPDLGSLKRAIESNKQRSVLIKDIHKSKINVADYQLIILYQPNAFFKEVIKKIKVQKLPYLLVTGTKTDWSFINKAALGFTKKSIQQTEEYVGIYNDKFTPFYQKDIDFQSFPPLQDLYGEIRITQPYKTLLYQQISGVKTKQPLLSAFDEDTQKKAVLFGEGIWKWRATSYLKENSFQDFDNFIGNFVQYLASKKKRNRLLVTVKNVYPANERVTITAFYVDKNYQFDKRASLWLTLTNNSTKEHKKIPFSLQNNTYQVALDNAKPGKYTYKVSVEGQKIARTGTFLISNYRIEEQFTNANHQKLQKLAVKTGGKRYFSSEIERFEKNILTDTKYYITQKTTLAEKSLLDWKWILFLIIILLSVEWFLRKYYGKI